MLVPCGARATCRDRAVLAILSICCSDRGGNGLEPVRQALAKNHRDGCARMRIRETLFASLVLLPPTLATAQSWPTHPGRSAHAARPSPVSFRAPPGGAPPADILARMVGERLAPVLGQPVIV